MQYKGVENLSESKLIARALRYSVSRCMLCKTIDLADEYLLADLSRLIRLHGSGWRGNETLPRREGGQTYVVKKGQLVTEAQGQSHYSPES